MRVQFLKKKILLLFLGCTSLIRGWFYMKIYLLKETIQSNSKIDRTKQSYCNICQRKPDVCFKNVKSDGIIPFYVDNYLPSGYDF